MLNSHVLIYNYSLTPKYVKMSCIYITWKYPLSSFYLINVKEKKKNSSLLLNSNYLFFEVVFIPAKITALVYDFVVGKEDTWGTNWLPFSLQAQSSFWLKKAKQNRI